MTNRFKSAFLMYTVYEGAQHNNKKQFIVVNMHITYICE